MENPFVPSVSALASLVTRSEMPGWPGPKGSIGVGQLHEVWSDPLGMLMDGLREHGDFVRFRFLWLDYFLASDPAAIQHVLVDNHKNYVKSMNYAGLRVVLGQGLVTSEGDFWKRQRRLAQPAFHRESLAGFVDTLARCASDLGDRWTAELREKGGELKLDVHEQISALTFRIVGLALLSKDLGGEASDVGKALEIGLRWANEYVESLVRIPPSWPTPKNRAFRQAQTTIEDTVRRVVEERRRSPNGHRDLLGMLMAATDESGGMSDRQLMDELLTLVLAGHETTANALTFALHLLSRHPHVLRRLRAEVDGVLCGRAVRLEDLAKMPFTKAVIDETLRLFPPAWIFERTPIADDVVCGRKLPKGTVVAVSPFVMHRHPRFWENPEGFEPERFLSPDPDRPKHAYLPFGAGPRICIGNAFALMEMQAVLPMLVQRFDLSLEPAARFELDPGVTLRPKGGMRMRVRARRAVEGRDRTGPVLLSPA